jgi:CBS domain containing-hemolysin-like protein
MVPRVRIVGIEVGAGFEAVGEVVERSPHTRYPVFAHDLDHVVGVVHMKVLLRRLREGRGLGQSDIRPVPFIPASSTLDTTLAVMRRERVQMAVVMDEHGGTDGILTMEDLFEEVVGEIEETARLPEIQEEADGSLRVAGTARLDDVGDRLGLVLEHEEVDTVSGLVLALLDRPPQVGDTVTFSEIRFEVLAVEGHGVAGCRATRLPAPE